MDRGIAEDWALKLESGEYPQGSGYLNAWGNFCCLGVLCEMAVEAGVIPPGTSEFYNPVHYSHNSQVLPMDVVEWAGMLSSDGEYPGGQLTTDNDQNGVSFTEIAAIIRKYRDEL